MPVKNYRELLFDKNKPLYQNNDSDSLEWIRSHKPIFVPGADLLRRKEIISILREAKPWKYFNDDFYINKKVAEGIHGRDHAIRVAINLLYIVFENNIQGFNVQDLIYCALLHDCSRCNDNKDEGHGRRSSVIARKYFNRINIVDREAILSAIAWHDSGSELAKSSEEYQNNKLICDLLRTADSLDRFRFPRDDWWINESFLDIIPSSESKNFSFDLCINCEESTLVKGFFDYDNYFQSIN
ncbi:MAG: hypothetical protein ACD_46C00645G0001 [uncultured bacterium]|nr:MAG: hypothetical protein ACD_46C00645G0001 [uncultured bacterium]